MSIQTVDTTFDKSLWNRCAPHPMVSWEWGEAREKMDKKVVRLVEGSLDAPRNVFQLTFHPIPYTPYSVAYMPRTVVPTPEVLEFIADLSKKEKALFIKIEPYVRKDESPSNQLQGFYSVVRKSPHPLFPEWTQMLDIGKSEEDLLNGMKPKWRYNIRLAQKKGVEVREMTSDEGFKIFSDLYFQTTARQSYKGHNMYYHKVIFDTLKENMSHILIAFYEGKPLSAYHLFLFNDILYYPYGGSSEEHKNVMASNLLMWETIKFGKVHGAKLFDMWGSLPPIYAENGEGGGWAGFTRFKEGFGTEFVEFIGSFDYVLHPVLYSMYNAAHIVRRKLIL